MLIHIPLCTCYNTASNVPTPLCHDTDHRMLLYQPQVLSLWSCGNPGMWSVPGETSVSWMSASPSMMRWSGRQCEWLAGMFSSHEVNKCVCMSTPPEVNVWSTTGWSSRSDIDLRGCGDEVLDRTFTSGDVDMHTHLFIDHHRVSCCCCYCCFLRVKFSQLVLTVKLVIFSIEENVMYVCLYSITWETAIMWPLPTLIFPPYTSLCVVEKLAVWQWRGCWSTTGNTHRNTCCPWYVSSLLPQWNSCTCGVTTHCLPPSDQRCTYCDSTEQEIEAGRLWSFGAGWNTSGVVADSGIGFQGRYSHAIYYYWSW